jgi:tetratricopeptide (TPR) repeat protein
MQVWSSLVLSRRLYLGLAALVLLVLIGLKIAPTDEIQQHFERGYAYKQKGMKAHAMREYRAVLERLPDHQDALLELAALYSEEKQYDRALKIYRTFLEFYPEAALVRFLQGNAYVESQRYEDAISAYEEIAPSRPQWAALWGRLGYAYSMVGQFEQAAGAYRRTLKTNPDSSLVRYQLARLYQDQENIEAAIKEFLILLEGAPDNHDFHTRLADLLIKQEEAGKETFGLESTPVTRTAEKHLQLAIQLSPGYVYSRWSMGFLLARQSRYIEAIGHFEKILELTPLDHRVHGCLGNLYERSGNEEKSRQHFTAYARAERGQQLQSRAKAEFERTLERLRASLGSRSR